jgi:cell division protein FtsI/penicillin-binding protein 2
LSPHVSGECFAVVTVVLSVLIARLWYLQISARRGSCARAPSLVRTRPAAHPAPARASSSIANQRVLATNRAQIVISVIPDLLRPQS